MPENIDFILGRVEGKVDALLVGHSEIKATQKEHDDRITKIENKLAYYAGITFAASSLVSFAAFVLDKFLK